MVFICLHYKLQTRLNELMKREQERAKLIHKSNNMKENSNAASSGIDCNGSDEDTQAASSSTINKSQSAYNICQNKRNSSGEGNNNNNNNNSSQQSSGLSKRLTNSTMRLSHSKESPNSKNSGKWKYLFWPLVCLLFFFLFFCCCCCRSLYAFHFVMPSLFFCFAFFVSFKSLVILMIYFSCGSCFNSRAFSHYSNRFVNIIHRDFPLVC